MTGPARVDAPGSPEPPGLRAVRGLVPLEIAAVIALALVPLPYPWPVAMPLFVVACGSRWARGRSWSELVEGGRDKAGPGALAGAAALAVALVVGAPFVEAMSDRLVEWSTFPAVRGSLPQLVAAGLFVIATSVAFELSLRGWLVERVLELSPGPAILPVLLGGFAEALLTPGDTAARIGALVFGLGLGWMYVAGGRNVIAPICARVAFSLGALVLEALRVIG